jgi:putative endonuclease
MQRTLGAFLYILECRNGVGTTRGSLESRVSQHKEGTFGGYTGGLRPVKLVFAEKLDRITDAIAAERQIKNWSRAKKEALIRGDFTKLKQLAKGRS